MALVKSEESMQCGINEYRKGYNKGYTYKTITVLSKTCFNMSVQQGSKFSPMCWKTFNCPFRAQSRYRNEANFKTYLF
jgi:hypothetical protein